MEHRTRSASMESQSGPLSHSSTLKCRQPSTIVTTAMLKSVIRIEEQVRSVSDTEKPFKESSTENLKLPNIEHRTRSPSIEVSPLAVCSKNKTMSETVDIRCSLLDTKEEKKHLRRSSLFEGTPLTEQTRSVSVTRKPKHQGISTENLKLPEIRHRTRSMESSSTRPVTLKLKCRQSSTVVTTEMLRFVRRASTSKKKTIMSQTFDFSHSRLDRKDKKDSKSFGNIGSFPEMSRAEIIEIYRNRTSLGIDDFEEQHVLNELLSEKKYQQHSDFGDIVPLIQISNDCPSTIHLEPSKAELKRKNSMPHIGSGSLVLEGWIRSQKRGSTASN